ncbi:MAG TPA: DUF805 domain-containing protein, partial [Anaerolineaceae bacterium]|nr:DUF805 domain-containing protein [Anaerolineaceae bacterium]
EQEQIAQIEKINFPKPAVKGKMSLREIYFSPIGRIGLRTYWIHGMLIPLIVLVIFFPIFAGLSSIFGGNNPNDGNANVIASQLGLCIGLPLFLAWVYSNFMIMIKRLHDLGLSGRELWKFFIPLIGWLLWIPIGFSLWLSPGNPGPNQYGDFSF